MLVAIKLMTALDSETVVYLIQSLNLIILVLPLAIKLAT